MPVTTDHAIESVRASIEDLRRAYSQASSDRLHIEILAYCGALHDVGIIDANQYQALLDQTDTVYQQWQVCDDAAAFA